MKKIIRKDVFNNVRLAHSWGIQVKKQLVLIIVCLVFAITGCDKNNKNNDIYKDYEDAAVSEAVDKEITIEPVLSKTAEGYYQFKKPVSGDKIAEFIIEGYGTIRAKLFLDKAPETAGKFIKLAEGGYYDGLAINRILEDYMIQVSGNEEDDIEYFNDEIVEELNPFRGALCAANLERPDTSTSWFFMVQADRLSVEELTYLLNEGRNMTLKEYLMDYYGVELSDKMITDYKTFGGAPWLTGRHTVFGQIYEGYDVLDKIAETAVKDTGIPYENVIISKVTISEY